MRFTLDIKLGNAAMLNGSDIAAALREAAYNVAALVDEDQQAGPFGIRDANGNLVGEWEVKSC